MYVYLYVYAYMCVWMFVCNMYVCMYMYIYICIYMHLSFLLHWQVREEELWHWERMRVCAKSFFFFFFFLGKAPIHHAPLP